MRKNVIGWVCLGIFLVACEQEEINYPKEEEPENYRFSIPLSLTSSVTVGEGTDYVPMATKADDQIKTMIEEECRCLVLKEIESQWYVDTLLFFTWNKSKSYTSPQPITADGNLGTLDLVLRPGTYRLLVVANPNGVDWNPALIPGYKVKGEATAETPIPYAFTYTIQQQPGYLDYGYRSLFREIFTGTYQFTVSKTGDLHSDPVNGNGGVHLTRKVSRFRILLKGVVPSEPTFAFESTYYFAYLELEAQGDNFFCDGIDCWGNAYYNRKEPTSILPLCISTSGEWHKTADLDSFQLVLPNHSTYSSALVFTDETKNQGLPYAITLTRILGQSGGFTYYYPGKIEGHTLFPNSIDGIVVQPTDRYRLKDGYKVEIEVEPVDVENTVTLFPPFYEVNH